MNALPEFVLDVIVKATLVLTCVLIANHCLSRSSAALRHRLLVIGFSMLLVLPALSYGLPHWRLAVLPSSFATSSVPDETRLPTPTPGSLPPQMPGAALPPAAATTYAKPWDVEPTSPIATPPSPMTVQPSRAQESVSRSSTNSDSLFSMSNVGSFVATHWSILAWCVGGLFALLPMLTGALRVWFTEVEATTVGRDESERLDHLRRQLGIRRNVRWLESARGVVPMTWGILSPVVLTPDSWRRWRTSSLRLVLLHELAHIKRLDVASQWLARFACTLYWFHPLAWYALRRMRVERELACDDCVLMAGESATGYARQLLQIARSHHEHRSSAAVAMAHRFGLETRIKALLDRARSRVPVSARLARGLIVVAFCLVSCLAAIRLDTVAATSDASEATVQDTSETPSDLVSISGVVTKPDGSPASGASVRVIRRFIASTSWQSDFETIAKATADQEGRFNVEAPAQSERFSNGQNFESQATSVVASLGKFAPDQAPLLDTSPLELQLGSTEVVLNGTIVDLEGSPVEDATVSIVQVESAQEDAFEDWKKESRNNPATLGARGMMVPAVGGPKPAVAHFPSYHLIDGPVAYSDVSVTTDHQGRFRLVGMGDNRLVTLRVEGPGIATSLIQAVANPMGDRNLPSMDPRYRAGKAFGPTFTYATGPSRTIRGRVTDRESGEPIANVQVALRQFAGDNLAIHGFLTATTDATGRYQLEGVPVPPQASASPIRIAVLPAADQPYFRSTHRVPSGSDLRPVELDLPLTKAVWARGQVVDEDSGEPVQAMVAYYPFLSNTHAAEHESFDAAVRSMGYDDMYATDHDGQFRVPALPGKGVLRVVASAPNEYEITSITSLADAMESQAADAGDKVGFGLPAGAQSPVYHLWSDANRFEVITRSEQAEQSAIRVTVKQLNSIELHAIDSDGNPVSGFRIAGKTPTGRPTIDGRGNRYWERYAVLRDSAKVFLGNEEERRRPVILYHPSRKLGAIVDLKTLGPDTDRQQVTLRPCGRITGTLVDAEDKPLRYGFLRVGLGEVGEVLSLNSSRPGAQVQRNPHLRFHLERFALLDEDGTFEHIVPPGSPYTLLLQNSAHATTLFEDWSVGAGEQIELGKIDITADASQWPAPKRTTPPAATISKAGGVDATQKLVAHQSPKNASSGKRLVYEGVVVDPDGKPVADAALHFVYYRYGALTTSQLAPVGRSNAKGRFHLEINSADYDHSGGDNWKTMSLVAAKEGYGIIAKPASIFETTGQGVDNASDAFQEFAKRWMSGGSQRELKLERDDRPIEGRVVDLDGQPVAGATVQLREIAWGRTNLDAWEKAVKQPKADYYSTRNATPFLLNGQQLASVVHPVTTDENGAFTLQGIGRDRIVELAITGPTIEAQLIKARTRDGEVVKTPHQFDFPGDLADEVYHPRRFTLVASPSKPIDGRVIDARTGKGLPGVLVSAGRMGTHMQFGNVHKSTYTDETGRFVLNGIALQGESIYVVPPQGSAYLPMGLRPQFSDDEKTLELTVRLNEAEVIRGKAIDGKSGRPVQGHVQFLSFAGDEVLENFPGFARSMHHESRTNERGEFEIAAIPGRGVLTFTADDHTAYRRASELPQLPDGTQPKQMYRTVPSMLSAFNVHSLMEIDVDQMKVPVQFVLGAGSSFAGNVLNKAGAPVREFVFFGRNPTGGWRKATKGRFVVEGYYPETGRSLIFFDPATNDVGELQIDGKPSKDLTVHLGPGSILRGRVVDSSGAPVVNLQLSGNGIVDDQFGDTRFRWSTNDDGRFEIRGLIPGRTYTVRAYDGISHLLLEDFRIDDTGVIDLGDIEHSPSQSQ